MIDFVMPTRVEICIRGIDLAALKKLSLVSHALGRKIGGAAGREQECLAGVLDDLIREIELASIPPEPAPTTERDGTLSAAYGTEE